jgi:hypothetical protein
MLEVVLTWIVVEFAAKHYQPMQRKNSDRFDAVKLTLINFISLTLVAVAGAGLITFEIISVWHLIRDYIGR